MQRDRDDALVVALDTNVWISALLFSRPGSVPIRTLQRVLDVDILASCDELEDELVGTFERKSGWTVERITRMVIESMTHSIRVTLKHRVHLCRDKKDDFLLECAALAGADVLVTGDKDLLVLGSFEGVHIIKPWDYVNLS